MHKLDRPMPAPACLAAYHHAREAWADLRSEDKRALRAALVQMQGDPRIGTVAGAREHGLRCAYCEGRVLHAGHIEHFRRKALFPQLTFDWDNLFLACGSDRHCGHFKDRKDAPAYDAAQLIKPDVDQPDDYLYFHASGEVRVRGDLTDPAARERASETIRVFGLDDPVLEQSRRKSVDFYKQRLAGDLDELMSWSPAQRQAYLAGEIMDTRHDPHATVIKHFLQRL